jgi:hypothetical protein
MKLKYYLKAGNEIKTIPRFVIYLNNDLSVSVNYNLHKFLHH